MIKETDIRQFIATRGSRPVVDVRSPKEFAIAHIPGAINIPLFNDEERHLVGIAYKKEGREKAISEGLSLVGPKLNAFVEAARKCTEGNPEGLYIHCWRGGMRSKSMAMLFDFSGIKTTLLKGGYKSYRQYIRTAFNAPFSFIILGGKTGSAKTKILHALNDLGEQVIDLERLANHKGSAFGDLGEEKQPSTEMFENLLFDALEKCDPGKRIWLEDESHLIGTVFIPEEIWIQMRSAPVIYCDFPLEERIQYLVKTYGDFDAEGVIQSVHKITKRLGGQHAKAALELYAAGNLAEATRIVLVYYDKTYTYGLQQRDQLCIHPLPMDTIHPAENAKTILSFLNAGFPLQQNNTTEQHV